MTNAEARTTKYRRENLASKTRNHEISMKARIAARARQGDYFVGGCFLFRPSIFVLRP
jgi:hypothetical protein